MDIALIVDLTPVELSKLLRKYMDETVLIGDDVDLLVSIVEISKEYFERYKDCGGYYQSVDTEGIRLYVKDK